MKYWTWLKTQILIGTPPPPRYKNVATAVATLRPPAKFPDFSVPNKTFLKVAQTFQGFFRGGGWLLKTVVNDLQSP